MNYQLACLTEGKSKAGNLVRELEWCLINMSTDQVNTIKVVFASQLKKKVEPGVDEI